MGEDEFMDDNMDEEGELDKEDDHNLVPEKNIKVIKN